MKITGVKYSPLELKLSIPYSVAYGDIQTSPNIFLKVETNTGVSGFGCAAPDPEVTGEDSMMIIDDCRDVIEPVLKGADPLRIVKILEELKKEIGGHPSSRAMVDMALYDIMAKVSGIPLYKLLGGYRDRMKTSITVGILPVKETVKRARGFIEQGFKILKIKGGMDMEEDVVRVKEVRRAVGNKIGIRFDANQGYTVEESIRFVNETREAKVELLEQPTPKEELEQLGSISSRVPIPVMADESLLSLRDAFRLARRDLVDTINVKLMKAGGITEAMRISAIARAARYEVMVGCMDEAALGISAGLHFALARPTVAFADLDGHLDLIDDPTSGAVILKNGTLFPSDKPGLGAEIDI